MIGIILKNVKNNNNYFIRIWKNYVQLITLFHVKQSTTDLKLLLSHYILDVIFI